MIAGERVVLRRAAVLLALGLVVAACGTTVDPARLATLERAADGGLGPVLPTITSVPSSPGDPGAGNGDGSSGPVGGTPTLPGTSPGPRTQAPTALGVDLKARTISVGFLYTVDQSAANAAIGAAGITGADEKTIWDILVQDLNARGGIAGLRVVPVYREISALSSQTIQSQLAAACETFTRDHQVFAALGGQPEESYVACLERDGVATVTSNVTTSDERTFPRYPHLVEISSINVNRLATAAVEAYARQGYFSPGARVGVLAYDSPSYEYAIRTSLLPALARHGVRPKVIQISEPLELNDYGALSAQISNAVLRFNTGGIDHVILFERQGEMSLFFMQEAESQRYRPRYGLSGSGNTAIVSSVPERQLHGAVSIGASPTSDVTVEDFAKIGWDPSSRRRCTKLLAEGGITYDSPNAEGIGLSSCDHVWFLEQAVELASSGAVTTDTWLAGVNGMGTRFESAQTFQVRFSPSQHDGMAKIANMAYVPGCTCFRYTSAPYFVP